MTFKARLMDEAAMSRALMRIAHEIVERNDRIHNIALVGIRRRGVPIAEVLAKNIEKITGTIPDNGVLDITLYRDDLNTLSELPTVKQSSLEFEINGKNIILVDDVIFTGRTVRAAIDALFAQGRPHCIQLAVLIDRGHRQLPIRPDYVGKNIPTSHSELIRVKVPQYDGDSAVDIYSMD